MKELLKSPRFHHYFTNKEGRTPKDNDLSKAMVNESDMNLNHLTVECNVLYSRALSQIEKMRILFYHIPLGDGGVMNPSYSLYMLQHTKVIY